MADTVTKHMLAYYESEREPTMFFAGMFQAPPRNFHNSEEVEIDIIRGEEEISIAIQDLSTGARYNSEDLFTNKGFKPPIHKEAGPVNAHKLISRNPGEDPYMAVDFQANAIKRAVRLGTKLQRKIARAIEYQAAQVLTTGTATLIDENGASVYAINYAPKVTHFPTSSIAWDQTTSTKLADIAALANVIRADGLDDPDMLIMGDTAFELFIKDTEVQALLNNRRIQVGGIVPMDRMGNGGTYRGTIEIENYSYDIWTYAGRYKHPQTGVSTKFLPGGKVIVRSSMGRLDATFGGIPRIATADPRIPVALTSRITVPGQMLDLQMNAWFTPDGETMMVQAGTRPLMIPTDIDSFGCLTTGV